MRNLNGLTILEVVIAIAVLAVGVLAAAGLQASALRATSSAQELQRMNSLARSQLDSWRGTRLTQTTSQSFDCSIDGLTCTVVVRPCVVSPAGLSCDVSTVAQPGAHNVSVTVSSADRDLDLHSVVIP